MGSANREAMTHDPIPKIKIPLPGDAVRLWVRDDDHPYHWTMVAMGHADDVERVYADLGIHRPELERLILPATEKPCGRPAKCSLCRRIAEYRGRATDGELVLLCIPCFHRASKQ